MATSPPGVDRSAAAGRSRDWPLSLRPGEATVLEQFVRAQAEATGGGEHPEKAVTLSQGELTRATRLSQPSVSRALMELEARGILEEDGTYREGRGHPTTQWRVTDNFYVIGINIRDDFGTLGTPGRVQGVATTLDGRRLGAPEPPYDLVEESASVDRVIERIITLIRRLPKEEGLDAKVGRLISVGVSLGGHIYAGQVIRSHNLGWKGVALQEHLHHALSAGRLGQVSVIVENNATSFAASLNPEGGPPGRRVVVIVDDRGLGCGLFLGGQLWQGDYGKAGELGHTPVLLDLTSNGCECSPGGPFKKDCRFVCRCGKHGCLQAVSTPEAITRAIGKDTPPEWKIDTIDKAAALLEKDQQDPVAVRAFDFAGRVLGYALANLALIIDPERLCIYARKKLIDMGNPAGRVYLTAMYSVLKRYSFSEPNLHVELRPHDNTDAIQEQAAFAIAGDVVQRFLNDQKLRE